MYKIASKVAARYWFANLKKFAGPLTDVSHLRNQAVFMMGAGGSGKSFVAQRWLKYMPGGGSSGLSKEQFKVQEPGALDENSRGLTNLSFERAVKVLSDKGFLIELNDGNDQAQIPFKLHTYDNEGREQEVDPKDWKDQLPPAVFKQVKGLEEVIFGSPIHELPSYWRQVNPDVYKEELKGYLESEPGYVHEMSSAMNKAYFQAAVESGDPMLVDGTGTNLNKMKDWITIATDYGYKTSLVWVYVPLTINQIRNATRKRKVDPNTVTHQFRKIADNFEKLKSVAKKAKKVDNRNDSSDFKKWDAEHAEVNNFISRKTSYPNLYEYIKAVAPEELTEYGAVLSKYSD